MNTLGPQVAAGIWCKPKSGAVGTSGLNSLPSFTQCAIPSFLWDPWCDKSMASIVTGASGTELNLLSVCSGPDVASAKHSVRRITWVLSFDLPNNPGRERRVAPSCNKDVRLREVK